MWQIEVGNVYTGVVTRLVFHTEEEAIKQRNILLPLVGKDRYDLKTNGTDLVVTLTDACGTVDILAKNVLFVRLYNMHAWDQMCIDRDKIIDSMKKS